MSPLRSLALFLSIVCSAHAFAQECSRVFESEVIYRFDSLVVRVVTADFDGDGRPDVAAAASPALQILMNRGGRLVRGTAATAATALNVFPANADGDGRTDLVAYGGAFISTLFSNGDGTFRTVTATVTGTTLSSLGELADVNGDGRKDVIAVAGRTIRTFAGGAGGTFSELAETPLVTATSRDSARDLAAGDWNRDGRTDLVVTDARMAWLYAGNGDGTFAAPEVVLREVLTGARALTTGDFDSDGKEDLILGSQSRTAMFLSTRGAEPVLSENHVGNFRLWSHDVNGDGKLDVVTSAYFLLGNGDGTFQPQSGFGTYPPTHGGGIDVAFADMDADGDVDLVAATGDTVRVRFNRGNLTFESMNVFLLLSNRAVAADVNEDGRDDVITFSSGARIFLSGDGGTLSAPSFAGRSNSPGVVADFNGDAHLDLASVQGNWLAFGDGTGTFGAPRDLYGGSRLFSEHVVAADFNGDGHTDITTAVHLLINDGTGAFTITERTFPVGDLAAGDFNGDGKDDLIGISSEERVLFFPGGTEPAMTVVEGVRHAAFPGGGTLQAVDVDGDSHLDVVAVASSGTELLILGGNGNGTFRTPRAVPVSGTGSVRDGYDELVFTAADFTGDGRTDLVAGRFEREALLLEQQSGGSFVETGRVESGRNFGLTHGDFDGDGHLDLLSDEPDGFSVHLNRCREALRAVPPVVAIDATSSRTSVTVSASVPPAATGNVEFFRRLKTTDWWELVSIGTAPVVAGTAALTAEVPAGTHEIYAVYSGNGAYARSYSATVELRVSDQDTPARRRSVRH